MSEKESRVEQYLDEVCAQVRCRKAHAALREELRGHLEERMEECRASGMEERQAAQRATEQMGDSVQLGRQLNRTHRPQVDWLLLAVVGLLAGAGAALMAVLDEEYGTFFPSPFYLVTRFVVYLCIGVGVMLGLMFLDYRRLQRHPMLVYAAAAALVLLAQVFGVYDAQDTAYINLGFVQFSPKAFAVPMFLLAFAGLLANYRGGGAFCMLKLAAAGAISVLIMLYYPSLTGAVLLAICDAVMLTLAIVRGEFRCRRGAALAALYGGGALLLMGFVGFVTGWNGSYFLERFGAFLHFGAAEPTGAGYQYAVSHQWLSAAEWFGPAQGMAQTVAQSLPAGHTDYVFVSAVALFGWAAGAGIIVLAAVFIGRIARVGRRAKSGFGSYLCFGVATLLAAEFLMCILAGLGLMPNLSVSMPFLSYGGSQYVVNLAMVGLVLSVWRYNNLFAPEEGGRQAHRERMISFEDGKLVISFR